jgi:6-phosphofructokinase 2
MQQIVTITLNPAIDKSTSVKSIVPDRKLRCADPKFEPGGGGVNVSRAIKKMGGNSSAIYFAGGYSGKFFESLLDEEGIESIVIPIGENTRENMIVVDESSNLQYRFGFPGPTINQDELDQFLQLFEEGKGVEYIVASGSLPEGIDDAFFSKLASIAKQKKAKLIIDTSGEPLRQAINEGVYMIKPNLGELSMLHGVAELQDGDITDCARGIIERGGAEVIVVSMGPSGAMLITKDEVFHTKSPTVRKKSTVGAGDTMVAGMVLAMSKKWNWQEVLRYGVAAGTATTMNSGTELCKKEDVEKLYACLKRIGSR